MRDNEYYRWHDCDGFPNYQINKMGQVRNKQSGKVLKGSLSHGYITYTLRRNGKTVFNFAHILVAKQFIPNPENKNIVNHIDENRRNCCIDNLEWVNDRENSNHGTAQKRRGGKIVRPVNEYDLDGKYIRTWKSIKAIVEFLEDREIDDTHNCDLYNSIRRFLTYNETHEIKRAMGKRVFIPYNNSTDDIIFEISKNQWKVKKYQAYYDMFIDNMVIANHYLYNPNETVDEYCDIIKKMMKEVTIGKERYKALSYALECMNTVKDIEKTLKKLK